MAKNIRCLSQTSGSNFSLYRGDCVDVLAQLPPRSIGFCIYSPPFEDLFTYSEHSADMGNTKNSADFFTQYGYLVKALTQIMMPGRLVAIHCSELPYQKWKDGYIGLKDFPGDLIRAHEQQGWVLHTRKTIWKDPAVEMMRTKALGLLHKQLLKDSSRSRFGMPDYLVVMRTPGENGDLIDHRPEDIPVPLWQEMASPVWMNIQQGNTLNGINGRRAAADADDEKHICPLQLDLIEQAYTLWTKPNDIVLSPFAGIGSEGYVALKMKRRFIGVELKQSYYETASRHLSNLAMAKGFFE